MKMAIDLVDVVKGYLTPDVIQKAATHVGESSGTTQKALAGILPTLVVALMYKASTSDGAQQLLRMIEVGRYDGNALNNVTSLFGGGAPTQGALSAGRGILDSLFGTKLGDASSVLARAAGVRPESASSLLALAAPLVMHVLGRQRASVGPGAASLANLLGEQSTFVTGLLPAGLGAVLGWSGLTSGILELGSSGASAGARVAPEVAPVPRGVSRPSWVLPLIIFGLLALGVLAWLSWPTSTVREAARKISELQLPGGVKIAVADGSLNFSLANWLANTTDMKVPKRFVFDDLNFEAGSARLTPDSVATVGSLVAILNAYPAVTVMLEGHTDNTGDPAANEKLSIERAVAVKQLMVKAGIAEPRVIPYGYGQERPVAPNDTEQGRAKNRRLELVVDKR
jgi:OmpA-OmpF porin, OOP family